MSDRFSVWLLESARNFDGKVARFPDGELCAWAKRYRANIKEFFEQNPSVLERFRAPVCNEYVHDLVCGTLGIESGSPLTDEDVRRAVCVALYFPLRQSVGSCFATAPAILVQSEQVELFLDDMHALLTEGKLRRVESGREYTVPINVSDHDSATCVPLLKAWEYTIASFADYQVEFFRWNLRASLGLDHEAGIGKLLYDSLDVQLVEWNRELEKLYEEHHICAERVRMAESLLAQASTPDASRRQKAEFDIQLHQLGMVKEMISDLEKKTKELSAFFKFLMEFFEKKLPDFFQEVYDPSMVEGEEYDDSPAGFRLMFKHGRANPSLWTRINEEKGFVEAVREFFVLVEHEAIHACAWEEGKGLIASLITSIAHYIEKKEFMVGAYERVKALHGKVGTQERAPWSYVAGGNMESLLKGYYSFEGKLTEEKVAVESEADLAIFLIETLKDAPPSLTNRFLDDERLGILMQSPTHACILRPGFELFKSAWSDRNFTYTWVRDRVIEPSREFYNQFLLKEDEQKKIAKAIGLENFVASKTPLTPHEMCQVAGDRRLERFFRFPFLKGVKNPPPILFFADTNWSYYDFGFAYNPGSDRLELWRVHKNRKDGFPMAEWKKYLDGSEKKEWSLFMRPFEYGGGYSQKEYDPRMKI